MDGTSLAPYIKPEAEDEAEPDTAPDLSSDGETSGSGSEHVIKREERWTPGQGGELCHSRNRPACLIDQTTL
jgi:hypothetical protein